MVTWFGAFSSDYRIKTNVEELNDNYTVNNLRPVKYYNLITSREEIGVIAYELQECYSFLVTGDKDGENIQKVNYNGLIGILIHEVKKLKTEINNLKLK